MSKEIRSQDSVSKDDLSNEECGTKPIPHEEEDFTQQAIEAYKEAARADAFLFGDYNGYEAYGDIPD